MVFIGSNFSVLISDSMGKNCVIRKIAKVIPFILLLSLILGFYANLALDLVCDAFSGTVDTAFASKGTNNKM